MQVHGQCFPPLGPRAEQPILPSEKAGAANQGITALAGWLAIVQVLYIGAWKDFFLPQRPLGMVRLHHGTTGPSTGASRPPGQACQVPGTVANDRPPFADGANGPG